MQITKSKTAAIAIAILLTFSMTASLILVPSVRAQSSTDLPTYAYINVAPNPAGVGQKVLVIMWLTNLFSGMAGLSNDYRFHNYELTITAPDGSKTTTTFSIVSDPTSDQDYTFTPTMTGSYNFNFTFPGQPFDEYPHDTELITLFGVVEPEPYLGDTYLPSSASTNLTVQSTAVPAYPTTPLPTSYWTRPIYGINSNWYTVSSNWLGEGAPVESCVGSGDMGSYGANGVFTGAALNRYPGDAVGSLTSHIMWTKPLDQGGIVGGDNFAIAGDSYFEGSAYVQRFCNPIIIDGILYYQAPLGYDYPEGLGTSGGSGGGTYAVNLQTGQQIWYNPNIPAGALSFGYIYDAQDVNQKGVEQPILFTSDFGQAYDAWTGQYLFNATNMPGGIVSPQTMGPNGETLEYVFANGQLAEWNSSHIWNWNIIVGGGSPYPNNYVVSTSVPNSFTLANAPPPFGPGGTTTYHDTVNLGTGSMYDYIGASGAQNATLPAGLPSSFSAIATFYGNMILCESGTLPNTEISTLNAAVSSAPYMYFGINLNSSRGAIGSLMWKTTVDAPPGNLTVLLGPVDPQTGVFTEGYQQTMQWVGYNLYTGAKIWGPTASQASLDYYGNPITPLISGQCAYGNLYSMGYAGIMYCYNDLTGVLKWTYGNGGAGNSTSSGPNTPFGDYPTFIQAVGNGVIYVVASEHTINTPIYKGALARAINATNGQQIWTLSDYTGEFAHMSYAMADGYNTWFNGYDSCIYVVGRGPSQTTVTAPESGVTTATPVVIRGTVMDVSAGTKQNEQAADFPNGVPCAADSIMQAWMGYVYQQQPEPTNFVGVPVTLSVLDSNGNHYNIGTVTTDSSGMYTLTWTPDISGNYTVYATFAGTNAYYQSSAETSFYAGTPPATPAPTAAPVTGLASTGTVELGIVAVIIVIIIIGAILAVLTMRKRP
jgi:hypothetical protein